MPTINTNESLSIILPVYNEEKNIGFTLTKIIAFIKNLCKDFELILVNDGSTDKSEDTIRGFAKQYPAIRLINNSKNKGYGAAIKNGIHNAKKEWLLIMDSDGQFEITALKDFWNKRLSYDFIIGYRKKRSDNAYRKILGKTGNLAANLFLKTDIFIKDINCGFKLFKTNEIKKITLGSNGGIINFEIMQKLLKNGARFLQIPVNHYSRTKGNSTGGKLKTIIQIISEFIYLIANLR